MALIAEFLIPLAPTPKLRQRVTVRDGHGTSYTSAKQKHNASDILALASKYAPKTPAKGSLRLDLLFCVPMPKSLTKRDREGVRRFVVFPAKKPDLDNYQKQIMDCMTKLRFWEDDSQVCITLAGKMYSERPGWFVRLHTCQPDALWRILCSGWNDLEPMPREEGTLI